MTVIEARSRRDSFSKGQSRPVSPSRPNREVLYTYRFHPVRRNPLWISLEAELKEWSRNAATLFDESDRPAPDVLKNAMTLAAALEAQQSWPVPSLVTASGSGRIMFEWCAEAERNCIELLPDDQVEVMNLSNDEVDSMMLTFDELLCEGIGGT